VAAILNENLGKDNYPDLLTISFGTAGNVCDLFGIRSVELEDLYIRLDNDIAHLLEVIDDRFGKDNVLVVLTSDRGASDNIEYMDEIGMPVGKFYPDKTLLLLESFLKGSYGFSNWVKYYSDKQIYLNDLTLDKSRIPAGEVQIKAAQFLSQFQAIANVSTAYAMQTSNFTAGELQRFQNSYNMSRSGDILICLKPGWIEMKYGKKGEELDEYNAYRYNSHVPLIFYGNYVKSKTIENPVSMTDVAPTIARILGIPFPNNASGKVIDAVLNE
jgi:arylsulfatase A-like enzyme